MAKIGKRTNLDTFILVLHYLVTFKHNGMIFHHVRRNKVRKLRNLGDDIVCLPKRFPIQIILGGYYCLLGCFNDLLSCFDYPTYAGEPMKQRF